jgi:hypothetical protein
MMYPTSPNDNPAYRQARRRLIRHGWKLSFVRPGIGTIFARDTKTGDRKYIRLTQDGRVSRFNPLRYP